MAFKRIAFWGTGNISRSLAAMDYEYEPEFYIDNDPQKRGKVLFGKIIYCPADIEDWKELFIVVASGYYPVIKRQLEEIGLSEGCDFQWYLPFAKEESLRRYEEEAEQFSKVTEQLANQFSGKILMFSACLSFDRGVSEFLNEWNRNQLRENMALLSEAPWKWDEGEDRKLELPYMILPRVLQKNYYFRDNGVLSLEEKYKALVQDCPYLTYAVRNLRQRHEDMCKGYEFFFCYHAKKIVSGIIERWKPERVILWNEFYAFHHIVKNVCRENEIPVTYIEFGHIPGTFMVEDEGQMGESFPAKNPEAFRKIPVTGCELREAEELLDNLYRSRLNRNVQPKSNELKAVKDKLKSGRPVIFYAGQNDFESGLQPYDKNARKYHSPIFGSSEKAAVWLARLCWEEDWNFLYKPHPIMKQFQKAHCLPENVIELENVDIHDVIDIADVTVTILSTVCYTALIRKKPVVMLGYTQLKKQGCTYEAFEAETIRESMENAIRGLQGESHGRAFQEHIARLIKYYREQQIKKL